ncbi:uncharacterized protein LOC124942660 [Impatiens glandulifera]|uniref:uncharacterized protein LOC124942660 n=1 Tax=Impatiens glandulifera TaxID=253017 RepID=UPI001FB13897|nr:uncharacterized protein LOC124942660 [Impatiens glandulifera]
MERSEPTLLIPQWLKGSGNVTSGGITSHQTPLSSWLYDDHSSSKHTRNRSTNVNSHDIGRSIADRTASTYFRQSSSSNGLGRTQSSFGRGRGDNRRCDYSDTFENILQNRVDKDLRRAQSLITGKFNNNKSNQNNSNGLSAGSSLISTIHKTAFERDFPSLGADEKKTTLKVPRVSSPVGHSIIIGGDGWTSALAEAPTIFGSVGPGAAVQQPITSTTASMAATVAQRPSCANNISQVFSSCPLFHSGICCNINGSSHF